MNHQPFLASLQSPVWHGIVRVVAAGRRDGAGDLAVVAATGSDAAPRQQAIDLAAVRAEAVASGRADGGLRETEALRAQLAIGVAALAAATAKPMPPRSPAARARSPRPRPRSSRRGSVKSPRAPADRHGVAREDQRAHHRARQSRRCRRAARSARSPASRSSPTPRSARRSQAAQREPHELDHKWSERLAELRTAIHAAVEDA